MKTGHVWENIQWPGMTSAVNRLHIFPPNDVKMFWILVCGDESRKQTGFHHILIQQSWEKEENRQKNDTEQRFVCSSSRSSNNGCHLLLELQSLKREILHKYASLPLYWCTLCWLSIIHQPLKKLFALPQFMLRIKTEITSLPQP